MDSGDEEHTWVSGSRRSTIAVNGHGALRRRYCFVKQFFGAIKVEPGAAATGREFREPGPVEAKSQETIARASKPLILKGQAKLWKSSPMWRFWPHARRRQSL